MKWLSALGARNSFVSAPITLVSSNGPAAGGGLAAVVRGIGREFARTGPVQVVARFAESGPDRVLYSACEPPRQTHTDGLAVTIIAPSTNRRPCLPLAQRLVHRPPLQRAATEIFDWAYGGSLRQAVFENSGVVHYIGAGWEMLGFSALRAARRLGAVFSVWPAIHTGEWGDSGLDARLYRAADIVFAQSGVEAIRLQELGVAPERVTRSPCGPTPSEPGDGQRFRRVHGLSDRPIVLFVGRKQMYKGFHALCAAMPQLLAEVPDCCLVAIGRDVEPPYPTVPAGHLLDLGACSDEEKEDAMAACDVFCMPSTGESFGIAYVEAWAAGKPVVGGPAPAVRELIRAGIDGFAVSQSPEDIAMTLAALLADRDVCRRLGVAGQERQRAEFTWERAATIARDAFTRAGRSRQ